MKTQFFNYLNYFKTQSLQEKFIICFLGALTLTCLVLLLFAFVVVGAELTGVSLATFPLIFTIDTETGKGDRANKIKQMKSLLNDTCTLWYNNILIGGGSQVIESRKDMTESKKNSYYGGETETTLTQITIIKPPKTQQEMDILLDGINDIWSESILFCMVQNKMTNFNNLLKFNKEYKEKKKGQEENKNKENLNIIK